ETYKHVSQDIRDQLNAEAEAVQIILTGIDNDICSTVDACPNACETWKAIESLEFLHVNFGYICSNKKCLEERTSSQNIVYNLQSGFLGLNV
nr:hypothetical protein [Tanacetum cinerariifolium]